MFVYCYSVLSFLLPLNLIKPITEEIIEKDSVIIPPRETVIRMSLISHKTLTGILKILTLFALLIPKTTVESNVAIIEKTSPTPDQKIIAKAVATTENPMTKGSVDLLDFTKNPRDKFLIQHNILIIPAITFPSKNHETVKIRLSVALKIIMPMCDFCWKAIKEHVAAIMLKTCATIPTGVVLKENKLLNNIFLSSIVFYSFKNLLSIEIVLFLFVFYGYFRIIL